MRRRMSARGCEVAVLLWSCIALFAMRVGAQFEVMMLAPTWLPPMDAWYSGLMPYYLLLPAQVALLMVMTVVAWNRRVRTGRFAAAHPRFTAALRLAAMLYFGVMALRLGLNLHANGAEFWRAGAIPVAFHWVLALFLLVSARAAPDAAQARAAITSETAAEDDPDELPLGDIPGLVPPLWPCNLRATSGTPSLQSRHRS